MPSSILVEQTWDAIRDKVQDAVKTTFPLEGKTKTLVLHNVQFDEKEAPHSDIRSQEKAKLFGRTWGVPVYADIGLVDKTTGKEVDRAKVRLMTVPKPTTRHSYIVDGTEWQVDHLWKLRSGIYAHQTQSGEYEAEFNLAKNFARNPRLYIPFDPESKKLKLQYGDGFVPLYSVLKTLGVQDEDMKKAWGSDIYEANVEKDPQKNILRFYDRLHTRGGVKAKGDDYDSKASAVVEAFHAAKLLPDITKAVLGKPIDHVNGEALLLAAKRVLDVSRGNIKQDDRDSLMFKDLHSIDDHIHLKLTQYKTKAGIQRKINNNIDRQSKVRDIVTGDVFQKPLHEFFTKAPLSRNAEQTNPLEMLSNDKATTIIAEGYGGIKDEQTVTKRMKLINPSHLGFLDPIHTPESEKTGITLHLPMGVTKVGNKAKTRVWDIKEGKAVLVTPTELHTENIILPDQVTFEKGKPQPIAAEVKMKDPDTHEIVSKPFGHGRYILLSAHQLFDEATNLIPFLQNNQGNRTMTASRQSTQAVSLHHRETPLVQVQGPGKTPVTWEHMIGAAWSEVAGVDGKVVQIKKDPDNGHPTAIIVQTSGGKKQEVQLYNHFPLNDNKTFMHSEVKVNVGDEVKKDTIVADTNFTKNGRLALGTNLRVSYMPYKGYNFEDGIVISDSAAKKLSSEHMHRKSVEIDPEKDHVSKSKYTAFVSTTARKLTKDQMNKLADDGIVPVGTRVEPGDVLVAAVGKQDLIGEAGRSIGRLDKKLFQFKDKSIVWDSQHPGEVVRVVKHPNGKEITVHVKTIEPAEIGDKMVGRHGNKGIITQILPDHEMPKIGGPEGEHTEVLLNPSGVPTRINLGQMLETAAAKVAKKTGKPYLVQNFGGADVDYTEKVKKDLADNGLKDTEEIYDAETGKKLGDVLTGHQYMMKLKHQVEKKLQVRGLDYRNSYDLDHSSHGEAIGQLEFYALLAHGARANLREMATYKAEKHIGTKLDENAHLDFLQRVRTGQPLPAPQSTFAYKRFEALLNGLGVNVKKEGNNLVLTPLTDKGVLAMSNGEIPDPGRVLRGKDAKELEKGLFDPKITGGIPNDLGKGQHWSHITLAEPMPNPVFVGTAQNPGPAVVLSGLKFKEFEAVVKGEKSINGKTGGKAVTEMLKKIDVKSELAKIKAEMPGLRGTDLDKANRKAKYLMALEHLGMKPHEAYVMNHVPVLPPIFRPISVPPTGDIKFDDINHYYKALGHINNQLKSMPKDLPDEMNNDLRGQMYDVLKALSGLGGEPVYQSNREMKGILDTIHGDQPKTGYFQKHLMKRRQELSMRSTIIPEPAMHLDHVGLPKEAALELYKPFVVRELQSLGYNPLEGLRYIKEKKDVVWKALQSAMDKRPILLKRDPALHKFSIMAFRPQIVEGRAIKIHPLVTAGYNADFDGDTMSAFVPLTDEAVRESYKMFPSNNLFSSTHGGIMYSPDQEALLGLHLLSKWGKDSGKTFNTMAEALKAHERGQLHPTDVVRLKNMGDRPTTVGRLLIAQHLPESMGDLRKRLLEEKDLTLVKSGNEDLTGSRVGVHNILEHIAKKDPKKFANSVDNLKNLGNKYSYDLGFSFSLGDLKVHKEIRDKILSKYDAEAEKLKKSGLPTRERDDKIIDLYTKANKELNDAFKPLLSKDDNKIYTMVSSGARGKMAQFQQMVIAPMLMKDGLGETLPTPVKKSYSEGLDVGDYWTTLHGARMGTLSRVEGTSEPGRLTKEVVNVVIPNLIASKDCGTNQGIHLDVLDGDVQGRYLAAPVKLGNQTLKAGTLLTSDHIAELKKHKVSKVVVRSPLKCAHGQGICAKCYGLNENGELHEDGTNIGVIAGHALGEPATQLAMDSFHTGGVAHARGGGAADKFTRLDQLLNIPKTLPNAATLAKVSGRVEKIEKDKATNGENIYISHRPEGSKDKVIERHFIPAQLERLSHVKEGETISKGDQISTGNINPRDLLKYTDITKVQNYLTKELYDSIYKDEVRRRNIETVVRSLTNLTRIKDPGSSDHLHGDIALRSVVEEHNRNLKEGEKPIAHDPILKGSEQTAREQHEDWMARLNFQNLRRSILEGASKRWKSDLHGTNPIPAYAFGAEFGKGTTQHPHNY